MAVCAHPRTRNSIEDRRDCETCRGKATEHARSVRSADPVIDEMSDRMRRSAARGPRDVLPMRNALEVDGSAKKEAGDWEIPETAQEWRRRIGRTILPLAWT